MKDLKYGYKIRLFNRPTTKGLVIREGNAWTIKLALFALPSLFGMDPEELREDLEANLIGLDEWTDILSGPDFSVQFDRTLHILDDNTISLEIDGKYVHEHDLEAVMKNPQIKEVEATFKVFLLPISFTIIMQDGMTVNGYAHTLSKYLILQDCALQFKLI